MPNPAFASAWSLFARRSVLAAATGVACVAGSAEATWSILIADTRTGEIVIGSATCVTGIDLRRETPVLISGVGAVTAQSAVDISGNNRRLIRDRLLQGVPVDQILMELADTDPGHNNRQYGMITVDGGSLTFSGPQNAQWAGGTTGRIEMGRPGPDDDIVYAVQGNILSGENVVQAAVDAIISSDGDLPGRMMEAMAAARVAGGDGRCSCSPADPTGCGSPPPEPFKSAHVGYMLGTRAGDIDAARVSYSVSGRVSGMGLPDLDDDGMPDVVAGSADSDEIVIFRNAATPGDPLSHLLAWQTITGAGSGTVAIASGDFNNDGLDDFAVAHADPPRLSFYEGDGDGFGPPEIFVLSSAPTGMTSGELLAGGDTLAVSLGAEARVAFYGRDGGSYALLGDLGVTGQPGDVRIGELAGGGALDLAVAIPGGDEVLVYQHGGGLGFAAAQVISTAAEPIGLDSADMDLDGDNEIVVISDAGRKAQVFTSTGGLWVLDGEVTTIRDGNAVAVGAFTPDAFPDIITAADFQNRNLQLFTGDGAGNYDLDGLVRVGSGADPVLLGDMNGDGTLDIVVGNADDTGVILIDNPRGHDLPQPDQFAAGDYFMEFNIPFGRDDDPDPVDQMQVMFDDWRASLIGGVDAVRSGVEGLPRVVPGTPTTLTITLRDWQGTPVDAEPGSWDIRGGEGLYSYPDSPAATGETGIYELTVEAVGAAVGGDDLRIRAAAPGMDAAVQLMPSVSVAVVEFLADTNADGVCNFFDVSGFLDAFLSGDELGDLNGDGALDFSDVSQFIQSFGACSGG